MADLSNLDILPKDVIIYMAMNMDFQSIARLCRTNKNFMGICTDKFWLQKIKNDFFNNDNLKYNIAGPTDFYRLLKSGLIRNADEYNEWFNEDPEELFQNVYGIVSDETIVLIVKEMYIQLYPDNINLLSSSNYLVYNHSEYDGTKSYALIENPEDLLVDINAVIQYDINEGVYEDVSFESFHGKSIDEYLNDIRGQINQINQIKNIVVFEYASPLGTDTYILISLK
jgi:hypothetical protein